MIKGKIFHDISCSKHLAPTSGLGFPTEYYKLIPKIPAYKPLVVIFYGIPGNPEFSLPKCWYPGINGVPLKTLIGLCLAPVVV